METGVAVALKEQRTTPRRAALKPVSHNLQGQRLGRKGRDTRQRILAATEELLATDEPITLSAVARTAGLGMTSLYVYFADLTELLLALLEPIMASGEETYLGHLRLRWDDEQLGEQCMMFISAYYNFWRKHTRILHLRNAISEERREERMVQHRIRMGVPMVRHLVEQMDGAPDDTGAPAYAMAAALFVGLDRLVAVRTNTEWSTELTPDFQPDLDMQLKSEARLLELAIRDLRNRAKQAY